MSARRFRLLVVGCLVTGGVFLRAETLAKKTANALDKDRNPLFSQFQSFSAHVTGGIAQDHDRKIYRSGKWMRLDFDDSYRVTDLESLKMWGVAGDKCMEFSRPDAGTFPYSAYHDFKAESSTSTEEDTIDGHVCQIENVTLTPTDGRPLVVKMKLWKAKDLDGFPIRIDVDSGRDKFSSTYTDVSLATPDAKLFQHPAKCTPGAQPGQKDTLKIDPKTKKVTAPAKPPQ